MRDTLARYITRRGNTWALWVPDGLKMSGCVVGNPKLKGRWFYQDGSTWRTR